MSMLWLLALRALEPVPEGPASTRTVPFATGDATVETRATPDVDTDEARET